MKPARLAATRICCMGFCLLLVIALPSAALAQDASDNLHVFLKLTTSEIRAKTTEIVSGSMNFTEEEGKAFWPLYRKYEGESGAITDRMIALIKDYKANLKALSDAKAKELAEKVFEMDEQKIRLNRKYYGEFCKVLPPTRVLQFFQLSRRIDTLLNLQIASILPMIGEDW
jgi:hypothetical protein